MSEKQPSSPTSHGESRTGDSSGRTGGDSGVWRSLHDRDPLIDSVIDGRYRLVRLLAMGAVTRIYLGEQGGLRRKVAVKLLIHDQNAENDGEVRARFLGEAAALARLTHPNTVRVFDYGQSEGMTWLVMEYVEGRTLHHELRNAAFQPADAIEVVDQVCRSLEEAHQFGIVHRDLKPNNLILYADGTGEVFVKLMDFGIAKDMQDSSGITRQGALLGTPAYMAPEQVLGQAVDPRTDIYALGVMLFRLFTGRTPYGELTGHAVLIAHVQNTPYSFGESNPGLAMPPAIEWIVMRCLEKARSERIVDVAELRRGLRICRYALAHPNEEIALSLVEGRIQVDERILAESPAPGPIQHKLSSGTVRAGGLPTPSSASLSGDGLSWGSTGGMRGSLSQHAPGSGPPPAPSAASAPPPQPAPAAPPPTERWPWIVGGVALIIVLVALVRTWTGGPTGPREAVPAAAVAPAAAPAEAPPTASVAAPPEPAPAPPVAVTSPAPVTPSPEASPPPPKPSPAPKAQPAPKAARTEPVRAEPARPEAASSPPPAPAPTPTPAPAPAPAPSSTAAPGGTDLKNPFGPKRP